VSVGAPVHRSSARWRARIASNPLLVDALIALGLTLFSLVNVAGGAPNIGNGDPLSVVLLMLQTVPLVLRRRYPMGVLVVVTVATVCHGLLASGPTIDATLGGLVALYTVAERCDRRASAVALVFVGMSIGALILGKGGVPGGLSSLVQSELVIVIVWLLGSWSRERRQRLDVVEKRALLAEREREAQAERAVAEERSRIAREMHDVVAHHVSVIVIQAGAGLRSIDRRPDEAREALVAIDENGRRALADMRRMLGVLVAPEPPLVALTLPTGLPRCRAWTGWASSSSTCGGRHAGRALGRRQAAATRPGHRAVGLPDHPGGAHQLAQARARRPRAGGRAL
jgi:signal transduction histidine kinase